MEAYSKTIALELNCLITMIQSSILPASFQMKKQLGDSVAILPEESNPQLLYLKEFNQLINELMIAMGKLKATAAEGEHFSHKQVYEQCIFYRQKAHIVIDESRVVCDKLEAIIDNCLWPFPKYSEMLFFSIK